MTRDDQILGLWNYAKNVSDLICHLWNVRDFFLREDCRSVATEALILSIDNHDPGQKASLKTWINRNVTWSVKTHLQKSFNVVCCKELPNRKWFSGNPETCLCNYDLVERAMTVIDKNYLNGNGDIFWKYFLERFTMKEIAKQRNCSEANISLKISKIKTDIYKSPFFNELREGIK